MLEGRAGLPYGKAFRTLSWRLQGATSNAEDYRLPGLRGLPCICKRHNGIQLGAKGCELVDHDKLPPICHSRHPCISSHVICIGPASPRSLPKERDESSMHMHLVAVVFCVSFVLPYFWWVML